VKTLQAIENAHIVLYIVDAHLGVSEQDLKLLGFVLECGRGLVIAVNKWDGLSTEIRDHAKATIDRHLDFVRFAQVHYISALHGSGIDPLFISINAAYASAMRKLATPELNQLLEQAKTRHQPPLVHGRRVKLRYAHPGGHNPQRIVIHGNQLHDLPESYRKFLAHFFQKKLNLVGVPILIEFKTSDNPFRKKSG
jgi:GTP-binding protein